MKHDYTFYGWQASYFAGKARGYIKYKGLDFEEKEINLFDFKKISKATKRAAMPAIESKQGEWLSDTPLIIEELEKRHPTPSILTTTPVQTFVAELLHNWFDDAWMTVALHSRWSYNENWEKLNRDESGKALLPFAPKFIRNRLVESFFKQRMTQHLPNQGIGPESIGLLEKWSQTLLDILEQHFTQQGYLLGERPTVADFALFGPMFGHLNRDPWPKREWLDPRPHLQKWVEKMARGDKASGHLYPNDEIPATLLPMLKMVFDEYLPLMQATANEIKTMANEQGLESGHPLPRTTEKLGFKMLDGMFCRGSFTYSVWRMQRLQNMLNRFNQQDKATLINWLATQGQTDFLTIDYGLKLQRKGLTAALA
ncbi:glutathione S-transferase family protein [uncultured Paraglaciecola sp.]|uniref:glutathione S-transferase family protein n=1 Tax=uncultured Paraglaciecola sp. TaxID=1765024 RepID=UPI002638510C|nr:glutathione S-transferase family protein [uncultured Paraglaciecola sp.]